MNKKKLLLNINWCVVVFLLLGVLFKLFVTADGTYIFHMDSARDYVDVREMVELKKPRLIGQTSAIEGFYNGPGWYYFLAIPYILFDGDPYSGVFLMIVLWAIGGYFLYFILRKYGLMAWISGLLIWFGSPYISLTTVYSFNPHPILYLTPVFVFLLERYLKTEKIWYGISTAILAAFFFQWEMNTGVFIPIVIFIMIFLTRKSGLFKTKGFWISILVYSCSFLPQLFFDLKHNFIMSQAVLRFLGEGGAGKVAFSEKLYHTWDVFFGAFTPTMLNSAWMVNSILVLFVIVSAIAIAYKKREIFNHIDTTLSIFLLLIIVPFIGYLVLPVNIHPWHMVSVVAAYIGITAFIIHSLQKNFPIGWGLIAFFMVFCLLGTVKAVSSGISEHGSASTDPSSMKNELLAIDYAYEQAGGKNFKAYSYLPSLIDYPYQYSYWWYGLKKYGYTPTDYTYLPNRPQYISNKDFFIKPKEGVEDSQYIMLIKEPDRIKMRYLWEGNFDHNELVKKDTIGPLEVEVRQASRSAMINSAL